MVHRVVATEDIEPGVKITDQNVTLVQVQDILEVDNLVYRIDLTDPIWESVDLTMEYGNQRNQGGLVPNYPRDNRWAKDKVSSSKIYKGEMLIADKLTLPEDIATDDERIYNIPFDSLTTGGYNIDIGRKVDICVLYNDNAKGIKEYQDLDKNKVIDIVLAKKVRVGRSRG